jgi:hypothetical protein
MNRTVVGIACLLLLGCGGEDNGTGPADEDLVDFLPGTVWEGVADGFHVWVELDMPNDTTISWEGLEPLCTYQLEFYGNGEGVSTESDCDLSDMPPSQFPFEWSGTRDEAALSYASDAQCEVAETTVTLQSRQTLTLSGEQVRCGDNPDGPKTSVLITQKFIRVD